MSSRAPWLHGRYSASLLLPAPPPSSRLRPLSRRIPVIRPTLLHQFLDGTRTTSPVAQRFLATVLPLLPRRSERPHQPACERPYRLRRTLRGSASGFYKLTRLHLGSLALRPGDSLTIPKMALSMGFRSSVSLLPAIQATGLLTLAPVGLTPTENASLRWTH